MRSKGAAADFGLDEVAPSPQPKRPLDPSELPQALAVGQPGWRMFAGRLRILLDGEDVTKRCVGFDVAKRRITRQRIDGEGRIFLDRDTDLVAVETVRGKVKVEWR